MNMVLPMGDPLDGYRLPVYTAITDNIGGRTDINFTVVVSFFRIRSNGGIPSLFKHQAHTLREILLTNPLLCLNA